MSGMPPRGTCARSLDVAPRPGPAHTTLMSLARLQLHNRGAPSGGARTRCRTYIFTQGETAVSS